MIIDFHSHLLPGIDDGAVDLTVTKGIIDKQLSDGVDTIVATPHYYCEQQSIDDFIVNRDNAYNKVVDYYSETNLLIPKIILGAEVYYSHYLNSVTDLRKLCIQGTDYLMLELPYKEITPAIIDGALNLADANGVNLIIAHIERYLRFTSYKSLLPLLQNGVLGQINCSSIIDSGSTRRKTFKFIKDGYVHILGSDVHNTSSRPAYMGEAIKVLSKKFSPSFTAGIMNNANDVLHNLDIDDIY